MLFVSVDMTVLLHEGRAGGDFSDKHCGVGRNLDGSASGHIFGQIITAYYVKQIAG